MLELNELPPPNLQGQVSLEETLTLRRSIRSFDSRPLTPAQISQLLWAGQGVTNNEGRRTAPSAGATYPLEIYALLTEGIFHYDPGEHSLSVLRQGDFREQLCTVALQQDFILEAPLTLVISAEFSRTEGRYGKQRTPRYIHMEVGHCAQNVHLQAVSLGLGSVPVGAFGDQQVQDLLGLPATHMPLYLISIGYPR